MSNICRFTQPASQDIEEILDNIADYQGLLKSAEFLEKLAQKCRNLAKFPKMGKRRDELYPSLRSLPVDVYVIFYRLIPEGIEIIRVVSGYRDLRKLFEEDD